MEQKDLIYYCEDLVKRFDLIISFDDDLSLFEDGYIKLVFRLRKPHFLRSCDLSVLFDIQDELSADSFFINLEYFLLIYHIYE